MRNFIKLIIILVLSLYPFSSNGQKWAGSYKLKIDIKNQVSPSIINADISYDIQLPADSVYICLPLPFGNNKNLNFIIEPSSASNIILHGYFRPDNSSGLALIACARKETNFFLTFKNVYLQINPSSYSSDVFGINLAIGQTINRIRNFRKNIVITQLSEILVYSNNFVNSIPSPQLADRPNEHKIIFPKNYDIEEKEIIIYATQEKKTTSPILLIFLLVTNMTIGIFTAPKITTTFNKALLYGILSLIAMLSVSIFVHFYIAPISQIEDTTIIVTYGTLMGLLLGVFIYSSKVIFRYLTERNSTVK